MRNSVSKKRSEENTLKIMDEPNKSRERLLAEVGLSPAVRNTQTSRLFAQSSFGAMDFTAAVDVMREKIEQVKGGNLAEVEATLIAQAIALDAIFSEMARRAVQNMGEYLSATEIYMRLALKAQAQSRATLQTLAEIKNPRPVAFVKQANIAHGPQQVNNGVLASEQPVARAGNSENLSNELLRENYGQSLDAGAKGEAICADTKLEAVGEVNRAEN